MQLTASYTHDRTVSLLLTTVMSVRDTVMWCSRYARRATGYLLIVTLSCGVPVMPEGLVTY